MSSVVTHALTTQSWASFMDLSAALEELLAALSDASKNKYEIVGQMLSLCEDMELLLEETRISVDQHADFFCIYLALTLITGDLDSARFLWKRLRGRIADSTQVITLWETVGRFLWKRTAADAIVAIDAQPWAFAHSALLIPLLREAISNRQLQDISRACSLILITELSSGIGKSPQETIQICGSLGWELDATSTLVQPKDITMGASNEYTIEDMLGSDMIMKLAQHVSHLERDLPKLESVDKAQAGALSVSSRVGGGM